MQAAPAGLDVVFELLAALVGAVFLSHGHRPDAPGYPTHHGVFGVHAVAEEKTQVGRKVINMHAARQVSLDKGEAVAQREGQLADRVGAGLGNVVATDRHRVKITYPVLDKILGHITHHLQAELGAEDAGVLALVFFQDVGLHRATHVFLHPPADLFQFGIGRLSAVVGLELVNILVNGRVHEHRQDAGRRAVDGHADAGGRAAQIEPAVEHLHVVQRGD